MSIGKAIQNLIEAVQAKGNNTGRISDAKKEIEKQFAKKSGSSSKGAESSGKGAFSEMMGIEQDFTTLATGNFNKIKEEYRQMYDAQAAFIKEGGAYFEKFSDGNYKKAFSEMANESFRLFGSVKEIPQAFQQLQSTMSSFMMMSDSTRQSLARTTAVAQAAGIETGTFADILDSATLAFGKSGDEVESLANTIATMGQKFGMPASELARNFRKAQADMAYSSGKIMETFKRLQFTSRTTGVSFDSLTSAFGRSMDTFSGSASKAGTLNAILGRSVFNAVDLLGKTEAERVDTIVKGVKTSIGGDVNKLGKFQLLSVSEGLGLSVEDTRKLLSGKTTIDQALKAKEPKDPRERSLKAMAEAAVDVGGTFNDLEGILRKTRTSFANLALDVGGMMRKKGEEAVQAAGAPNRLAVLDLLSNAAAGMQDFTKGSIDEVMNEFETAMSKGDKNAFQDLVKKFDKDVNTRRRGTTSGQTTGESGLAKELKKASGLFRTNTKADDAGEVLTPFGGSTAAGGFFGKIFGGDGAESLFKSNTDLASSVDSLNETMKRVNAKAKTGADGSTEKTTPTKRSVKNKANTSGG
jgi:hypothetical protein